MHTVIIQAPLNELEISQLKKEFLQLDFIQFSGFALVDIPEDVWKHTEIFLGEKLSEKNLKQAPDLRWIHTPTPVMQRLCLKEIQERGNILISNTPETNTYQIGEYVIACVLAFTKNLFHWKTAGQFPLLLWDSKWRNNMQTLEDKIFLQIGLGKSGLSIAKQAKNLRMRVWGVDELATVHPYCEKSFSYSNLHSLLPEADVVSLTIPYGMEALEKRLGRAELSLMKTNSILSILGTNRHIDEEALHEFSLAGKFRGILLDVSYQTTLSQKSKLWTIPNLLLTPGVAARPKLETRETFRAFRFNLRQYIHGYYSEMQNLVDPSLVEPIEFL